MKRVMMGCLILFVVSMAPAVFAENAPAADQKQDADMPKHDCAKCKMRMHGMMGGGMGMGGERSVVATSDGGVVVVQGDTMTKYDKNLKQVNQVELQDSGMGAMHHMMKECPMMKKGHGMMKMDDDDDDDSGYDKSQKVEPAHDAHH